MDNDYNVATQEKTALIQQKVANVLLAESKQPSAEDVRELLVQLYECQDYIVRNSLRLVKPDKELWKFCFGRVTVLRDVLKMIGQEEAAQTVYYMPTQDQTHNNTRQAQSTSIWQKIRRLSVKAF